MIVDIITQTPGDFEKPSAQYKTKKYRTVWFLDDYKLAQFFEVNNKLIKNWKEGEMRTFKAGQVYTSLNCSLQTRSFIVAYHDEKEITKTQIKKAISKKIKI